MIKNFIPGTPLAPVYRYIYSDAEGQLARLAERSSAMVLGSLPNYVVVTACSKASGANRIQ